MIKEFYPTPMKLMEKIFDGVDWKKVKVVLEPSAGKGDMAQFILEQMEKNYCYEPDLDCIEIEPELRNTLTGAGFRVVHDDFLTFRTFKRYDLIAMNPPFSHGAEHLMKALDLMENGGNIICILNAETLRNPCTNLRKALVSKLDEYQASITYMQEAFLQSERPTSVEIAVVKVTIPEQKWDSIILDDLRKKRFPEDREKKPEEIRDVAVNDLVASIIKNYEMEVEAGARLIREYQAMAPYLMDSLDPNNSYKKPILNLTVAGKEDMTVNRFVRQVRMKYWSRLFNDSRFTGNMTSNLREAYRDKVNELADYDFSYYNVKSIQEQMIRNLVRGVEECIVKLFDELSYQYSYSDELSKNIHYYNGWKTNKAWIINRKVVLPFMRAWDNIYNRYRPTDFRIQEKLADIEKALNYLAGDQTGTNLLFRRLDEAEKTGQTKKIQLKYFTVTFYKKGTCHIEFQDLDLLKKLNIFGSQQKGWLPPSYGKKRYADMGPEEQKVVDEFEGQKSYQQTMNRADYFIYDSKDAIPALEMVG